jgi:P27 family predicted phage terminase small subunit
LKNSPEHLSADAKSWWDRITAEFDITDDAGQLLLQTAFEAFDRMRNCQAQIARDGELVRDRFDQQKPHPLLAAERDARSQMLLALKSLNLDIEPLRDRAGRPTKGFGWAPNELR